MCPLSLVDVTLIDTQFNSFFSPINDQRTYISRAKGTARETIKSHRKLKVTLTVSSFYCCLVMFSWYLLVIISLFVIDIGCK